MKKQPLFLVALLVLAALACNLTDRTFSIGEQATVEPSPTLEAKQVFPTQPLSTATEVQPLTPPLQPSATPALAATLTATAVPPVPTEVALPQPVVLVDKSSVPPQFTLLDPLTGEVKGKFSPTGAPQYGLTGSTAIDAVFYESADGKGVRRAGFDGSSVELKFINPASEVMSGTFLPSPDGKRIAWGRIVSFDATGTHYTLNIANVDGSGEKILVDVTDKTPFIRVPVSWSRDGQSLYYSGRPYGIGGYILFGGGADLVRVDLVTGKEQVILSDKTAFRPFSLSPDERTVVYLTNHSPLQIVFHEVASGKENTLDLPGGYAQAGDFTWSPDSQRVAMTLAVGNPDKEAFTVLLFDVASLAQKELVKDDVRLLRTAAWQVGNVLWLTSDSDNSVWGMDVIGGKMYKMAIPGPMVPFGWH